MSKFNTNRYVGELYFKINQLISDFNNLEEKVNEISKKLDNLEREIEDISTFVETPIGGLK